MTETQHEESKHFSILIETAAGSDTFTLREPYEGTLDSARIYAQNIANADGVRVKYHNAQDDTGDVVSPQETESV